MTSAGSQPVYTIEWIKSHQPLTSKQKEQILHYAVVMHKKDVIKFMILNKICTRAEFQIEIKKFKSDMLSNKTKK